MNRSGPICDGFVALLEAEADIQIAGQPNYERTIWLPTNKGRIGGGHALQLRRMRHRNPNTSRARSPHASPIGPVASG